MKARVCWWISLIGLLSLLGLFVLACTGCEGGKAAYRRYDRNVDRSLVGAYDTATGAGSVRLQISRAPGQGRRSAALEIDFKQPVEAMEGMRW